MKNDAEKVRQPSPADGGPPCCVPVPHIVTTELSLHYGARCVLRDVSMPIHRGCITAIVGPSGCGKSSFLQSLNRLTDLIPECRVEGRIRLDDEDVNHAGVDVVTLRRRVGMIFQRPNPFPFSIEKNLSLPLREHGARDSGAIARSIERALRDVALWDEVKDRLGAPAQSLSGGQQQRLCLVSEGVRLRQLELENSRLKRAVADLTLDNFMLKEVNSKKW
jgi:phosphate transport system ATP-binding protein